MKIAMVFDGLQIGGIERVGADYAKLLQQLGHDVTIINLNPTLNEMEKEFSKDCLWIRFRYSRKITSEQYVQLIKKGFFGTVCYLIASLVMLVLNVIIKARFKIMLYSKETFDITIAFSGHFNDLSFVAKDFLKSKSRVCWLHGALYSYLLISTGYLRLYNKIKNLVVLVDNVQEEVLSYNKGFDLNINKLYNPTYIKDRSIDYNHVEMLKEKYGSFIMMVGRIDFDKDQLTLIKAIEYIRNKYKFEEKLILVGDGVKRKELEEYVINQRLTDTVIFEGNRIDIQNYYSAAYLFTHSSPLEGLPTTLIEALYFKLPIVATDSLPGVREILGNNDYGIITPVADFEKLGEAIYKMYIDKELYRVYSEKSEKRFEEFSPDRIKEKLNGILSKIKN